MRKILVSLVAASAVLIPATAAHATPEVKVYVCHWANGNPHIIHISENALGGHFHEDGSTQPGHELDENFGVILSDDEEASCSGRVGPPGTPGDNGLTPLVICAPHVGLGFTFDAESVEEPFFVLEPGKICPLAGADGKNGSDGSNGTNGSDGASGSNGKDGANGSTGATGTIDTSIATELNNRLFLLEHAVPTTVVTPQTPAVDTPQTPATQTTGELPHTGSTTGPLVLLAGALIALGLIFRQFRTARR